MKKLKRNSRSIIVLAGFILMLALNACEKSGGGLNGWYVSSHIDQGGGGAYCFVDSKNVEVYTCLYDACIQDWMRDNKVKIKGKTYYYNYMSNYTYTFENDVIYIPMAGQILNKSGDTLRRDGSSDTFKKVK